MGWNFGALTYEDGKHGWFSLINKIVFWLREGFDLVPCFDH